MELAEPNPLPLRPLDDVKVQEHLRTVRVGLSVWFCSRWVRVGLSALTGIARIGDGGVII